MATRRWLGTAADIAQVSTITIGGTWAGSDTVSLTINNVSLVITIGTLTTTAQVATTIKQAFNGETLTDTTASVSPSGGAADIPEFLNITATVSASVVTLTADVAGRPFTLATTETSVSGTAVDATSTAATGKNFFSDQDNWSGNAVPIDNDDIVFDSGSVDCKYGLTPAIQPASFTRTSGYTGNIGLPEVNRDNTGSPYSEYRTKYLTFDNNTVNCAYWIEHGTGAMRTRLDAGAGQSTVTVVGKGSRPSDDPTVPNFLFLGSHASNVMNVTKGDVGVAFYDSETATVATVNIGSSGSLTTDAIVAFGPGVTSTTVNQQAGDFTSRSNVGTLTLTGGVARTVEDAAISTQLNVRGGRMYYNGTGTLAGATVLSGDGILDFSQDVRSKTVTNPIEKYGATSQLIDPHKVVASLVVDCNEGDMTGLNIGKHIRITRGTPA